MNARTDDAEVVPDPPPEEPKRRYEISPLMQVRNERRRQQLQAMSEEALRKMIHRRGLIGAIKRTLARTDITPYELPIVAFKTRTQLALLNKILPDMKATETTGGLTLEQLLMRERESMPREIELNATPRPRDE